MSDRDNKSPDNLATHSAVSLAMDSGSEHILTPFSGPDVARIGQPVTLTRPWTLGRAGGGADVGVRDPRMSRRHLVIGPHDNSLICTIEDLGAKNGSFLNGRRIKTRAALQPGDVVRAGDTLFAYEMVAPVGDEIGADLLLGASYLMRCLRAELALAARSGKTALLLGASGTGKEVAARALHRAFGRSGPFVAVNCGAIPKDLVESTLFGSKRGAFTGAIENREGHFLAAHGGTLFLDEVGELPPMAQPSLLRVLEDGRITPVGASRGRTVDVRIVAATNVDLQGAVARGAFRRDLYARLNQWPVRFPALGERRRDIPQLIEHLTRGARWTPNALEALVVADWPENVRGLANEVQRAATRAGNAEADVIHLSEGIVAPLRQGRAPMVTPDREELIRRLRAHDFNISQVARSLSRTRKQIYRWLERYEIDVEALKR
ncbi:MAG: DNA-binding NtrC family response regulator [Myxococcota bacterium]|jgi:DNA-binding NtrC family response regulator